MTLYKFSLAVVLFEEVPGAEQALRLCLEEYKRHDVELLPEFFYDELPEDFYDHLRGQYSAEHLLRWLAASYTEHDKVLGLLAQDIYIPGTNFVFGVAELEGRAAVVSAYRLARACPPARAVLRLGKEMVHELGHTFGLEHCEDPRCVMSFSACIADVDRKGIELCKLCSSRLAELLYYQRTRK
ncbi:MAG: archaemetzincin family Zn-dependent metalloprotease [bacterium]|nr:archaemetzincin family Zn-dependent metalloprotease [bacterium]